MREEFILRSILVCFFVNYLVMYSKAKEKENVVKVPKIVSILFGAPIGIGVIPEFVLLYGIANIISLIVGLTCYFFIGKKVGGGIYIYTWIALTLIVTIYDLIKYKD